MIFGYSYEEAKKTVVSIVFLIGAALALVLSNYNPSFTQACVALVGPLFAVIGVFLSKNHSIEDLSKAVAQLQGAAVTIVGYFTVVPTGTVEKITVLAGAAISVYAVFLARNEPVPGAAPGV